MQNLHEVNAVKKKKEKFFPPPPKKKRKEKRRKRRNQQMVVLSRSTARFVAGNMYQIDQSALHMANSVTSVEKATILLQSVQEEAVQS